jgi:hypothetical protein
VPLFGSNWRLQTFPQVLQYFFCGVAKVKPVFLIKSRLQWEAAKWNMLELTFSVLFWRVRTSSFVELPWIDWSVDRTRQAIFCLRIVLNSFAWSVYIYFRMSSQVVLLMHANTLLTYHACDVAFIPNTAILLCPLHFKCYVFIFWLPFLRFTFVSYGFYLRSEWFHIKHSFNNCCITAQHFSLLQALLLNVF